MGNSLYLPEGLPTRHDAGGVTRRWWAPALQRLAVEVVGALDLRIRSAGARRPRSLRASHPRLQSGAVTQIAVPLETVSVHTACPAAVSKDGRHHPFATRTHCFMLKADAADDGDSDMTPEPNGGSPRTRPDDVAEDAVMAARGHACAPKDNLRVVVAAAPEDNQRSAGMPPESLHVSKLRRRRGSKRPKLRRLGLLEYTLLLLIGVGIAITVVMAILDLSY